MEKGHLEINTNKTINNSAADDMFFNKRNILYRHQGAGVLLADKYDKFAFFYDLGTGRTVMALDIISRKEKKDSARFLIITSKSKVMSSWIEDAERFYPELRILPIYSGFSNDKKRELLNHWTKQKDYAIETPYINLLYEIFDADKNCLLNGSDIDSQLKSLACHYVITPESFTRNPIKYTTELGITGIVIDDVERLKNYNTEFSTLMRAVSSRMKYIYLLSGNAKPNVSIRYFSQMKIVDTDTFPMSFEDFTEAFCYVPLNKMTEPNRKLFAEMRSARSFTISKQDCIDLPDCVDVVRQIELPERVASKYRSYLYECMSTIKGMDESMAHYSRRIKLDVLMNLCENELCICAEKCHYKNILLDTDVQHLKINELEAILDSLENERVIVIAQFQQEVEFIENILKEKSKVLTACEGTEDLKSVFNSFRKKRARYLIAKQSVLENNEVFSDCSYVVYYSFSYRAEDYQRSHSPEYRFNLTGKCTYIYIQVANTFEEIMYSRARYNLSNLKFLNRLITHAAKFEIQYETLKPNRYAEYKYIKSSYEKPLWPESTVVKQQKCRPLLDEYLKIYIADQRKCLEMYEPSNDDIRRAVRQCFFSSKSKKAEEYLFPAYYDHDIEEMEFSWPTYFALKTGSINTISDIYDLTDDALRTLLHNEDSYKEVQLKLASVGMQIFRNYAYHVRIFLLRNDDCDSEPIEILNLSDWCKRALHENGISKIRHLRLLKAKEVSDITGLGRLSILNIKKALRSFGVAFYSEKEINSNCTIAFRSAKKISIEDLKLSTSTNRNLKEAGITSLGDLMQKSQEDLLKISGLGKKSLKDILSRMEEYGAYLEPEDDDFDSIGYCYLDMDEFHEEFHELDFEGFLDEGMEIDNDDLSFVTEPADDDFWSLPEEAEAMVFEEKEYFDEV